MAARYGNHYSLVTLDNGIVSFRHEQTGEILHGNVGPEKEARDLYIGASGLQSWNKPTAVVFDIGTGCGAQLLALLDLLETSPTLEHLTVYSFDLEKDGLKSALAARAQFASIERHHLFLERAQQENTFRWVTQNNKNLNWHFVEGDFQETAATLAQSSPELRADFFFYDFFSPASHPWLWTFELFKKVFHFSHQGSRLVTYSSATCVKAALAAAGFFVGTTIPSGKKAHSIIASGAIDLLENPLPEKFLGTFLSSHKPFNEAETPQTQAEIRRLLNEHQQFKGFSNGISKKI
jgi:queuine tRNA-ribosyltransferase